MKKLVLFALVACLGLFAAAGNGFAAEDALDEVNAVRAARGLPPFARDEGLSQAAAGCAECRAQNRHHGHMNDFQFVPQGSHADAAGAELGYWAPSDGWGTCCMYDNYQYAGAAYAIGHDGSRYMSLFVRGRNGGGGHAPAMSNAGSGSGGRFFRRR